MNNIDKGLDKIHNSVASIYSYADANREKISKDLINGFLLLIIFAIFGCFDFISLKFEFSYLITVSYWTRTISKAIAGVCACNIGINLSWDREIEKDEELKRQSEKYITLSKLKDQVSFNYFVVNFYNVREKKKAYVDFINRKIYRLNKHARNKDKLLYTAHSEIDLKQEELDDMRKHNRYCKKLAELEQLRTEEYINANIDNLFVKYKPIDPIIFELELDCKGRYHNKVVSGSVQSGKVKKTSSVFVSMLCVSMALTSIAMDTSATILQQQLRSFWYYLLTCCEDVGVVLWQMFRGLLSSRNIISKEMTLPLVNRNEILTEYVEWSAKEENKEICKKSKTMIILEQIEKETKNETMA